MQTIKTVPLSKFAKFSNIRLGAYYELPTLVFEYEPFMGFIDLLEAGSRPSGGINESDEGQAISLGGEQIGADGSLNTNRIPYVPMEYYENAIKGKICDGDILLCKDGALTGKVCQVDLSLLPHHKVMANEHIYVVRANSRINQKFLFYLMRADFFQNQIKDFAFHKKGQPGLNSDHIKAIKIPYVPIEIQTALVCGPVSVIEQQICDLQKNIRSDSKIIDESFSKILGFNYEKFESVRENESNHVTLLDFSNNGDLRFSAKFHRDSGNFVMQELTSRTDKKIKHYLAEPIVLGASVSPSDYSDDGEFCYISMATIKNWKFDSESASTVSKEYSDSKQAKTVRKNDIILARSGEGTIGKVALIDDDELQGVFADFTMRIRLKDYNPEFAYYYFRTTYFQYLIEIYKKGLGNNTNIFPIVVREFPMLDISLAEQQRIVDEIHAEIAKQDEIKKQIESLRGHIDVLIQDVLTKSQG